MVAAAVQWAERMMSKVEKFETSPVGMQANYDRHRYPQRPGVRNESRYNARRSQLTNIFMTIAIGTYFSDNSGTSARYTGFVICADTKIVASDGITTYGSKIDHLIKATTRWETFVIANASGDGNAANSLGRAMLQALADRTPSPLFHSHDKEIKDVLTETMTNWHNDYAYSTPPSIQFILGVSSEFANNLYFCEPPNTVLHKTTRETPITIGAGGRTIDPLIKTVIPYECNSKQTLLRLAYLMYRAKKDQARDCGGETDAILIVQGGSMPHRVSKQDMTNAEAVGPQLEEVIQQCFYALLAENRNPHHQKLIETISQWYEAKGFLISSLDFKSMGNLGDRTSYGPL